MNICRERSSRRLSEAKIVDFRWKKLAKAAFLAFSINKTKSMREKAAAFSLLELSRKKELEYTIGNWKEAIPALKQEEQNTAAIEGFRYNLLLFKSFCGLVDYSQSKLDLRSKQATLISIQRQKTLERSLSCWKNWADAKKQKKEFSLLVDEFYCRNLIAKATISLYNYTLFKKDKKNFEKVSTKNIQKISLKIYMKGWYNSCFYKAKTRLFVGNLEKLLKKISIRKIKNLKQIQLDQIENFKKSLPQRKKQLVFFCWKAHTKKKILIEDKYNGATSLLSKIHINRSWRIWRVSFIKLQKERKSLLKSQTYRKSHLKLKALRNLYQALKVINRPNIVLEEMRQLKLVQVLRAWKLQAARSSKNKIKTIYFIKEKEQKLISCYFKIFRTKFQAQKLLKQKNESLLLLQRRKFLTRWIDALNLRQRSKIVPENISTLASFYSPCVNALRTRKEKHIKYIFFKTLLKNIRSKKRRVDLNNYLTKKNQFSLIKNFFSIWVEKATNKMYIYRGLKVLRNCCEDFEQKYQVSDKLLGFNQLKILNDQIFKQEQGMKVSILFSKKCLKKNLFSMLKKNLISNRSHRRAVSIIVKYGLGKLQTFNRLRQNNKAFNQIAELGVNFLNKAQKNKRKEIFDYLKKRAIWRQKLLEKKQFIYLNSRKRVVKRLYTLWKNRTLLDPSSLYRREFGLTQTFERLTIIRTFQHLIEVKEKIVSHKFNRAYGAQRLLFMIEKKMVSSALEQWQLKTQRINLLEEYCESFVQYRLFKKLPSILHKWNKLALLKHRLLPAYKLVKEEQHIIIYFKFWKEQVLQNESSLYLRQKKLRSILQQSSKESALKRLKQQKDIKSYFKEILYRKKKECIAVLLERQRDKLRYIFTTLQRPVMIGEYFHKLEYILVGGSRNNIMKNSILLIKEKSVLTKKLQKFLKRSRQRRLRKL